MFEGKQGPRIYKRKEDAEFLAERWGEGSEDQARTLEIQVADGKKAREAGATMHRDLSIAARKPEEGETGWIVVHGSEDGSEKYEESLEVISEEKVG